MKKDLERQAKWQKRADEWARLCAEYETTDNAYMADRCRREQQASQAMADYWGGVEHGHG